MNLNIMTFYKIFIKMFKNEIDVMYKKRIERSQNDSSMPFFWMDIFFRNVLRSMAKKKNKKQSQAKSATKY